MLAEWLRVHEKKARIAEKRFAAEARKQRRNIARTSPALRGAVLWTFSVLLIFFLTDAALFRTGWYNKYLEPNSSAGEVEYHLRWLERSTPASGPEALVIGDSRIAEGFSARVAQAATVNWIHFINFGLPGSNPRVWYYALRDADPRRNRFTAIAIALSQYSDEDGVQPEENRMIDLNYVIGRLTVFDCFRFAGSFGDWTLRPQALLGCLFRGATLRRDLLQFLSDPRRRLERAKDSRNNGAGYVDGYGGKPEDLSGISVDWTTRTIHFPPGLKDWQISATEGTVTPFLAPQTGAETRYRKLWLGRIIDLYQHSATRIVFLELPRAPLPVPEAKTPPRFIDSVRGKPRVTVLPAATFRDLERPEVFADGLHLNRAGRPIFSERLGRKIAEVLESR